MKLASFIDPAGKASFGAVSDGAIVDLGAMNPGLRDLAQFLGTPSAGRRIDATAPDYPLDAVTWLPVIPQPGKIFCVGLNYRAHIEETGRKDSEYPVLFMRTATSQTGHLRPIPKPSVTERLDFEGEAALVIGRAGRNIKREDALAHVAGYACYNDVSARDWQRHTTQWTPGKNFDGTGAFGPWMVTPDELAPRSETKLTTRLNGAVVQQALLSQMVFSFEDLIAYISQFTTLEPGDVIVTGTPGGVGDRRTPPLYMQPGDRVEVEIDGVGVLENTIVASL